MRYILFYIDLKSASIIGKVFYYKFFFINGRWYIYLFSGTHIRGQERPKLRPNRTVTEVDRDRDLDRMVCQRPDRDRDRLTLTIPEPILKPGLVCEKEG